MPDFTRLDAYDYELPPDLIAQHPTHERDAARLLVVRRDRGTWEHRSIRDLPSLLQAGDTLVLNDSRVVPARLRGMRSITGGRWEGLFLGLLPDRAWKLIGQTRGRLQVGESVSIRATAPQENTRQVKWLVLRLQERLDGGAWRAVPESDGDPFELLEEFGSVPLPPYIRQGSESPGDRERYQTVYAARPGSSAAPTAGLHFTPELLATCAANGIEQACVTLHVGLGTFRPVSAEDIRQHVMHSEWCRVPAETVQALGATRARGGRVVCVGTTSLRTLETAFPLDDKAAWEGESRLFIYPPYQFRAVDALLTNFHLPKSSLLMLVSAFAGYELTRAAYNAAIEEGYRFFSYGDAMLIL
ncbi:MAG: tRNA preQ1(34) S-adenosylmethionine ribosyltransferase-isomerase QueA [Planctomycetaceae bacterium]|nr:tRNA preQ1(34) S-adenosylmethionine ribosyltransferase-isomerase QueA [Planctomycetaceae bacterium]